MATKIFGSAKSAVDGEISVYNKRFARQYRNLA
jgi:hypothetical protein